LSNLGVQPPYSYIGKVLSHPLPGDPMSEESEVTRPCSRQTFDGPCSEPAIGGTGLCKAHGGERALAKIEYNQYELELETLQRMERFPSDKTQFLLDQEVQLAQLKLETITNEMDRAEEGSKMMFAAAQDAALQTVAKLKLQNTAQHEKMQHLYTKAQVVHTLHKIITFFGEVTGHIEGYEELTAQFTHKVAELVKGR